MCSLMNSKTSKDTKIENSHYVSLSLGPGKAHIAPLQIFSINSNNPTLLCVRRVSHRCRCRCSLQQSQLSLVNLQDLQGNCIANIKFANREILSEAMLMCGNLPDFQVQSLSTGKSCSSFDTGCYTGPAANYVGPMINI